MTDKDGGEIRGTFFGENSAKFYDHIIEGKVYSFAKAVVKPETY